jgi:hypothetical protein
MTVEVVGEELEYGVAVAGLHRRAVLPEEPQILRHADRPFSQWFDER